jgi:hypothetical protein
LKAETSTVEPAQRGHYLGALLLAKEKLAPHGANWYAGEALRLPQVMLKPFEQRALALEFEIPPAVRLGEYIVIHLTQVAEGIAMGGYALVIRVVQPNGKVARYPDDQGQKTDQRGAEPMRQD